MSRTNPRPVPLEEGIRRFLRTAASGEEAARMEHCFEDLARYLVDYSDLFPEREPPEFPPPADWEEEIEPAWEPEAEDYPALLDLGRIDAAALSPSHMKEFFGWYLMREGAGAREVRECARVLESWLGFLAREGALAPAARLALVEAIREIAPEAERCARASLILADWARHGGGMPEELRGSRFEDFCEGNARLVRRIGDQAWFDYEDEWGEVGPVRLPEAAMRLLVEGDVVDAEFGRRGGAWWLVDAGAVYPRGVYVEVEELDGSGKTF